MVTRFKHILAESIVVKRKPRPLGLGTRLNIGSPSSLIAWHKKRAGFGQRCIVCYNAISSKR
jgi:hypothetical protein